MSVSLTSEKQLPYTNKKLRIEMQNYQQQIIEAERNYEDYSNLYNNENEKLRNLLTTGLPRVRNETEIDRAAREQDYENKKLSLMENTKVALDLKNQSMSFLKNLRSESPDHNRNPKIPPNLTNYKFGKKESQAKDLFEWWNHNITVFQGNSYPMRLWAHALKTTIGSVQHDWITANINMTALMSPDVTMKTLEDDFRDKFFKQELGQAFEEKALRDLIERKQDTLSTRDFADNFLSRCREAKVDTSVKNNLLEQIFLLRINKERRNAYDAWKLEGSDRVKPVESLDKLVAVIKSLDPDFVHGQDEKNLNGKRPIGRTKETNRNCRICEELGKATVWSHDHHLAVHAKNGSNSPSEKSVRINNLEIESNDEEVEEKVNEFILDQTTHGNYS